MFVVSSHFKCLKLHLFLFIWVVHKVHIWKLEDKFGELLCFNQVGTGVQTQVLKLGLMEVP